jgi:CheY-like chemotaxis protein
MKLRILIADDSLVCRKRVPRCVEQAGFLDHSYLYAGDGAQALELIATGEVDVLIADLYMPVMDGLELIRAIYHGNLPPLLLTVIMTGTSNPSLVAELARYQVASLIIKPVTPKSITRAFSALPPPYALCEMPGR